MAKQGANPREPVEPLSRFGVLVAQLESIVACASQQSPDPLLCFDLLSDLVSVIDEEPKEPILQWQRKCEDALYSLLILGARRPVRRLASLAMVKVIAKGDGISIYSRVSSLQGWLSDGKKSDPLSCAGASQCLGELYRSFGRRITSGLMETANIAAKLMKFYEDFVRQEVLQMLQNALEGSGGFGSFAAYAEAYRIIIRVGVGDKSSVVRIAAARCLKTFASIGGPGLGVTEFENSASYCVKALEDPVSPVRDAFAEALGALLSLGMNPEAQLQPRGRMQPAPERKLEGGLQKHLVWPFMRATGARLKDLRIGLTLSWVFFLQAIRVKYPNSDSELQNFALQAMGMLHGNSSVDAHALACVLYILRVGVTEQMTESSQRSFLVILGKQLESPDISPSMEVAVLRTLSYLLTTLGEVPVESKEILENTVVAALSHSSSLVRVEAALTLRTLVEVDPTCLGGLISYGVTTLNALRESVSIGRGEQLKAEVDSLHGQAAVLAAIISVSPRLLLGYPARLPKSVFEVSKNMLTDFSRDPFSATVEREAGWLLLASLINSMPKEELEEQVFDILSLWAVPFGGNPESKMKQAEDLNFEIRVWSAAVETLTAFIRSFISPKIADSKKGILLQPVLVYLSGALSYISSLTAKELPNLNPSLELFIIKTLVAYQSLADPLSYKSDHPQLIQICTTPFREPHRCEQSSALRMLLDKRDACLGPWIPGRDWFEDELRAFDGGSDGLLPCVWEIELPSFPQPEPLSKTLVNQMLQCFGIIFAAQDTSGKLKLLGLIEQCLKTGKKQPWHVSSTTNACVGLHAGLKASLTFRPQALAVDMLSSIQSIFQSILAEGEIFMAQRRALAEGFGLLARLGNDIFTARMTRSLLGDLAGASDSSYTGSIALALGCIHRSAGGMALSTLVPATVSSISLLAKSSNATLQAWSLHGLLLTIEAAGLSFVSHVQATLLLAMEILLSEETGQVDIRQGIGRLVNAIVAVLGPELAPGSTFFSRCKSVVSEISSGNETSTLLECVRFTQQLILFAPQAVSVHSHIQTLRPTLSSRQPILRHLAVSTLRHLIEQDPVAIIGEQIEVNLFSMLDGETDSEIGNLVRATIIQLLYLSCPSRSSSWIALCRNVVLATTMKNADSNARSEQDNMNGNSENNSRLYYGEDDENMIRSSINGQTQGSSNNVFSVDRKNDKHLRYRTRVFAAECLSHLPVAVGKDPAHFDLYIARKRLSTHATTNDWLVLHIQELISLAYQISTSQFENMQPIGVKLLSVIAEKFESIQDPELPGHLLMEQYQAQFVSAVRTALEISSGPLLLEAGLHLATKILTSSITSGDRVALQRLFSLISRPLNDFKDMYYPSFAEWVVCKIKIRLLAAHASVKCYAYTYLRRQHNRLPDDYLSLIPLFSKSSSILGKYWIWILKDYCHICFGLQSKSNYEPFLEGIQSALVSYIVRPCLDEAWPLILQAVTLDSVPAKFDIERSSRSSGEDLSRTAYISGYSMVKLEPREFNFIWGFALFVLFHGQLKGEDRKVLPLVNPANPTLSEDTSQELNLLGLKIDEVALVLFQSLTTERFYSLEMLSLDNCRELLQVLIFPDYMAGSLHNLVIPILSQIVHHCPDDFFESEEFTFAATELCIKCLHKSFTRIDSKSSDLSSCKYLISALLGIADTIACRSKIKSQWKLILALMFTTYKCFRGASTDTSLSGITAFFHNIVPLLKKQLREKDGIDDDAKAKMETVLGTWVNALSHMSQDSIKSIHMLEAKKTNLSKLILEKLSLCLEEAVSLAKLAWEIQHFGQKNENGSVFCFTVCKHCINCIQTAITDLNIQVQTVGLHVLKSNIQREFNEGPKVDEHSFLIFFIGELCGDIFSLIQNMLEKPVTNKSGAVISECLTLLVLLHKLSQASKYQQDILNLLLDAIILVASTFSEGHSQELDEVKGIAVRLVSHLAHIPSSAAQFREVLLAMPVTRRQKLQDIIRASVTQDYSILQTKASPPSPPPETPVLLEPSTREDTRVSTSGVGPHTDDLSSQEEDDWDAFQSFPAADMDDGATSQQDKTGAEPASVNDSPILERDDYSEDEDDFQEFSEARDIEISDTAELVLDTERVGDEGRSEGGRDKEIRSQSIGDSQRLVEERESESQGDLDLDTGDPCVEGEEGDNKTKSESDRGLDKEIFSESQPVATGEPAVEGEEVAAKSQDDGSGHRLVKEIE